MAAVRDIKIDLTSCFNSFVLDRNCYNVSFLFILDQKNIYVYVNLINQFVNCSMSKLFFILIFLSLM